MYQLNKNQPVSYGAPCRNRQSLFINAGFIPTWLKQTHPFMYQPGLPIPFDKQYERNIYYT